MQALVAGPDDDGIADALEAQGVTVTRLDGDVTRPDLEESGICSAQLYVLTDFAEATSISIARDLTDDLRIVTYVSGSVPEFVRGQLDLAVDPRIADATMVAEELSNAP